MVQVINIYCKVLPKLHVAVLYFSSVVVSLLFGKVGILNIRIIVVQLHLSRPVLAHNWLLALKAMIGVNYQSVTVSGHGSLYCE